MIRLVALVPDLMDRSRIEAAARAAGRTIEFVGTPVELLSIATTSGDVVIVDLASPGVLDVLPGLRTTRTIGFGSHVDHELLEAARAAGCEEVLPRSVMFRRLPRVLSEDR
jgi:hypothetical protein